MGWNIVSDEKTLWEAYEALRNAKFLALDTETEGVNFIKDCILGFGIGDSENQYYVVVDSVAYSSIVEVLGSLYKSAEIIFQNATFDLSVLQKAGFPLPKVFHDTMVMAWLLDENSSIGLKNMAKRYLNRFPKTYKEMAEEAFMKTEHEKINILGEYCCADVKNTIDLFELFSDLLQKEDLYDVYFKMEFPLMKILFNMEARGITLDLVSLDSLRERVENLLVEYKSKLIEIQGNPEFNINSPKQIESYLFDSLGYSPSKITKTGKRSTDSEVLGALVKKYNLSEYDFVPLLLKYREFDKLHSSFILSLLKKCDENGRIHTTYIQTGTSTGRLASQNPNLQNIPVRDDEFDIRKVFVPQKGYIFIIADYSQIELRVFAHFSGDKNMRAVFQSDGDIHAKTMELIGTDRRAAKVINFGILYGMGGFALSKLLDISKIQAENYITKFFEGYPDVKPFINRVNADGMSEGFVKTIAGRKRHLLIGNYRSRELLYKRLVLNSKIQGSAADIIKKAMLDLAPYLESVDGHMLLQIHDELVLEIPVDIAETALDKIKSIMCNVYALEVPLKVDIKISDCWKK
jgi:DNA polymerase I